MATDIRTLFPLDRKIASRRRIGYILAFFVEAPDNRPVSRT